MKEEKFDKDKMARESGVVCVSSPDGKERVCSSDGSVTSVSARETEEARAEKKGNLFIGTLNFFSAPYRGFKENYEKKYEQAKRFFVIDLVLLIIIGILSGLNIYLFFSRTQSSSFEFPGVGEIKGRGEATTEEIFPAVVDNNFLAQIKINGQEEIIVTPGEDLEYSLVYQNGGEKSLYDVALKVNLDGAILNFDKADLGSGVLRDGAVIWTKDQIPDFAELSPGKNGELKFKIGTDKVAVPARVSKYGNSLKSWLDVSYKTDSNFGESVRFSSPIRIGKINSDLTVQALARYYTPEGDQLGRGPLPPKVGEVTKYWIFLSVENNLNDVSDVSVSAALPPDVSWTGNISVTTGEISYNSARRAIDWKVGYIGRYIGEDWPGGGAAFEVAFSPREEQIGQQPQILEEIKIFGNDDFTGLFLEKKAPNITTELPYDHRAEGQGIVVQ